MGAPGEPLYLTDQLQQMRFVSDQVSNRIALQDINERSLPFGHDALKATRPFNWAVWVVAFDKIAAAFHPANNITDTNIFRRAS